MHGFRDLFTVSNISLLLPHVRFFFVFVVLVGLRFRFLYEVIMPRGLVSRFQLTLVHYGHQSICERSKSLWFSMALGGALTLL